MDLEKVQQAVNAESDAQAIGEALATRWQDATTALAAIIDLGKKAKEEAGLGRYHIENTQVFLRNIERQNLGGDRLVANVSSDSGFRGPDKTFIVEARIYAGDQFVRNIPDLTERFEVEGMRRYASSLDSWHPKDVETAMAEVPPKLDAIEGTITMLQAAIANPDLNPELAALLQPQEA